MTEEQEQKSFILVRFASVGSVEAQTVFENVTPLQVLAIAGFLELKAKSELARIENERAEQQVQQRLAVPKDKILIPGG